MPEDTALPGKRGVGRPRKRPTQSDERIGQVVDPATTSIGFDDGRTYLVEDGVIVELVEIDVQ